MMTNLNKGGYHCTIEMAEKLELLAAYISEIEPIISDGRKTKLRRFHYETVLIRIFSDFEHLFICLIYQGMIAQKELVKEYFGKNNRGINDILKNWIKSYQELWRYASSQVSFGEKQYVNFQKCFKHFWGFELFMNESVEQTILEFGYIRNIIVHHAGFPPKSYVDKFMELRSFIIDSNIRRVYGRDVLFEIDLSKKLVGKILTALRHNMVYIREMAGEKFGD